MSTPQRQLDYWAANKDRIAARRKAKRDADKLKCVACDAPLIGPSANGLCGFCVLEAKS